MRLTSRQQVLDHLEALRIARGYSRRELSNLAGYSTHHYPNAVAGGGISFNAMVNYFEVFGLQLQLAPIGATPRERNHGTESL